MTVTELHQGDPYANEGAPPQDLLAEESVLGACMLSARAIDDVMDSGLRGADFYRPVHETIWEAIRALHSRREPVDPVTLLGELDRRGDLARVGGPAYLHTLQHGTPTAANAAFYARSVREKATLRRLVTAGTKIVQLGYARDGGDVDGIVNAAQVEVARVADARHLAKTANLTDIADRALDQLESGFPAVPSPWGQLNRVIDGLRPGYLYASGARPGTGKTIFALQWAASYARYGRDHEGLQAVYFTFEMTSERLYQRLLASASGVSQERMRRSKLTDDDWRALVKADEYIRSLPIVLEGASGWTPQDLRAKARQLHRSRKVGLVVIDHIGLTRPERPRDSRQAEMSEAADMFLGLAHDLESAVHLLTQLNRGPTQRSDQRPVPSDIRDTDRIEQNSDVLMMLHRDKDKAPKDLDVAVAKNRDGDEQVAHLRFHGDTSRIEDDTIAGRS